MNKRDLIKILENTPGDEISFGLFVKTEAGYAYKLLNSTASFAVELHDGGTALAFVQEPFNLQVVGPARINVALRNKITPEHLVAIASMKKMIECANDDITATGKLNVRAWDVVDVYYGDLSPDLYTVTVDKTCDIQYDESKNVFTILKDGKVISKIKPNKTATKEVLYGNKE